MGYGESSKGNETTPGRVRENSKAPAWKGERATARSRDESGREKRMLQAKPAPRYISCPCRHPLIGRLIKSPYQRLPRSAILQNRARRQGNLLATLPAAMSDLLAVESLLAVDVGGENERRAGLPWACRDHSHPTREATAATAPGTARSHSLQRPLSPAVLTLRPCLFLLSDRDDGSRTGPLSTFVVASFVRSNCRSTSHVCSFDDRISTLRTLPPPRPHKEAVHLLQNLQVPPANCEDVRTSTRRGDTLDVVVLMPAVTARQEVLAQSLTETVRGGLDAGTAWVKRAPDVDPNLVPFEAPRDVSATAEARARHTGSAHLSSSIPALAQWTM